ncbi:MAG: trigger factor [Spirochaetaceae bacterium]|nr:trigger factor [Spirochaetaceae bacterium]
MAEIKEIKRLEHSAVRMTVTLKKDEIQAEYKKHVDDVLKNLQIPGFRRGKVPREVLERKAGSSLKEDSLNSIIGETIKSLFSAEDFSKDLLPLSFSDPELEGNPVLDLEKELEFSVKYDIFPEVKIQKWENIEVTVNEAEITKDDIQRELEAVRERNAIIIDREAGEAARKGDVVTVDYCELAEDDTILTGSEREGFVFEIGTSRNIYEFDDEITGMKSGEQREFSKTFAADFNYNELAGKTKKIRVKVKAVKKKELPDLDDDFAQDIDEKFKTLDDLKKSIQEKLQENIQNRIEFLKKEAILRKIAESAQIDLPESMIYSQMEREIYRETGYVPPNGLGNWLESNKNFADLLRAKTESQLKNGLVMEELFKITNIEVKSEDLEADYMQFANESGEDIAKIKEMFEKNGRLLEERTRALKEKKLFELLMAKNTIKKGKKVKYLDLFSENA